MGSGADESGEDMTVGRTNKSEERTLLIAINGENAPNGYEDDYVLNVSTDGDMVLVSTPRGVDAIHAKGTVSFPTGGAIGTIPAGNGIISQGINGVVGYVHAMARNRTLENSVGAGLLGVGGGTSPGVFGIGQNGVVGYEQATRAISLSRQRKKPASSARRDRRQWRRRERARRVRPRTSRRSRRINRRPGRVGRRPDGCLRNR